jgi:hypothetical protein
MFLILLRGPLTIISLSNLPESLLNPVIEYLFHFTRLIIRFYHLNGNFRPWHHAESTKQGEFLSACIHFTTMDPRLTTGSIHPHGFWKYRPLGTIWTGFRHCRRRCDWHWCYQSRRNKVSSCQLVCILQSITMYLPLDRFIHTDLEKSLVADDMDGFRHLVDNDDIVFLVVCIGDPVTLGLRI